VEYENFRSEGGVNEGGGLGFLVWDSGEGALRERRSGGVALGEKVFGGGGGKCKVSVRGGLWCFGGRFWVKKAGRIGQKRAESGRIGQNRAETGRNGQKRFPESVATDGAQMATDTEWRRYGIRFSKSAVEGFDPPPPGRWTASRLPKGIIP